jgi:hypothetical protein
MKGDDDLLKVRKGSVDIFGFSFDLGFFFSLVDPFTSSQIHQVQFRGLDHISLKVFNLQGDSEDTVRPR